MIPPDPEFQFLLQAVRWRLQGPDAFCIPSACKLPPSFDTSRLLQLAERHRVVPVLGEFAEAQPDLLPADTNNRLQQRRTQISLRNMRLAAELASLAAAFAEQQLSLIAIKGPVLALRNFGGIGRRQFNDLDVLVPPQQLAPALTLLQEYGCQILGAPIHQLPARRLGILSQRFNEHSLILQRHGTSVPIDLHWRFSDDTSLFPTHWDQLLADRQTVTIAGQEVYGLSPERQLAYLAFHSCKHQCMRMSWVVDCALALGQFSPDCWSRTVEKLPVVQRRMVWSILLLLEQLKLVHPVDDLLTDAPHWRSRLQPVISTMLAALQAETPRPVSGAFSSGLWKWRLSGRIRPLLHSLYKSVQPAQRDLAASGPWGPCLSRLHYLWQGRRVGSSGSPNHEGATDVCQQ